MGICPLCPLCPPLSRHTLSLSKPTLSLHSFSSHPPLATSCPLHIPPFSHSFFDSFGIEYIFFLFCPIASSREIPLLLGNVSLFGTSPKEATGIQHSVECIPALPDNRIFIIFMASPRLVSDASDGCHDDSASSTGFLPIPLSVIAGRTIRRSFRPGLTHISPPSVCKASTRRGNIWTGERGAGTTTPVSTLLLRRTEDRILYCLRAK